MRTHKIVRGLVKGPKGFHLLYVLMVKAIGKDGKWNGKWEILRDDKGRIAWSYLA